MARRVTASKRVVLARAVLAAAVGAVVATTVPAASGQVGGPIITPSVQVTDDIRPGRAHSHAIVLVHPDEPNTVVIADVNFTSVECEVHVSRDGGRTWRDAPAKPMPPEYKACLRPSFGPIIDAKFGPDGTLYYASTGGVGAGAGPSDGYLARSADLGETWEFTVVAKSTNRVFKKLDGTTLNDDERFNYTRMAIDPTDPNRVYVGYRVEAANNGAAVVAVRSVVAASSDGGRTFGPMVDTVEGSFPREQMAGSDAPAMAVDRDGAVYSFTKERPRGFPTGFTPALPTQAALLAPPGPGNLCKPASANPEQPAFRPNPTPAEFPGGRLPGANEPGAGARLLMSKSTDGGQTWESKAIDDGGVVCIPCLTTPEVAIDAATGNIYVVFELSQQPLPYPRDNRDIFFVRSTDGGDTWTPRMRLNDDSDAGRTPENPGYDQLFPGISVAPNGRIDVAWHDFRTDALYNPGGNGRTTRRDETCWDVFATYSSDGGATWATNVRVSDRSMNQNEGFVLHLAYDLRGPIGVASTDAKAIIAWPDSRNGSFDVPTEDTYLSTAIFEDELVRDDGGVDGGSVALGAAIALVVAGIAVAGFAASRGPGGERLRAKAASGNA